MITESSFSGSLSQRIRRRYFYSPMASLFTVVVSAVIAFIVGKLVLWGLVNAVWTPDVQACGQSSGACWGFVAEKWRLIIFGRYPYHLQWRAAAATGIVLAMLVVSSFPFMWRKPYLRTLGMLWSAAVVFFFRPEKDTALAETLSLGFAAGIMIAASVWSLIIPGLEMAEKNGSIP